MIVLIQWRQANVVIDQSAHARLTEYGLAPINSGPSFTAEATPGAVGSSRWSAPEIINPPRKGNSIPEVESKPADVFAFAMLAVEVFTGKVPFDKQKNEAVVVSILEGSRPKMPENAQAVGLTGEMWNLLESCWRQDPKKRPTMEEVVRRWQRFVEHNNDGNVVTECVQTALLLLISPLVPFSIFYYLLRSSASAWCAFRRRWFPRFPRFRTISRTTHSRPNLEVAHQQRTSEAVQPQAKHEAVQPQTKPEAVRPQTVSEAIRPRTMSETVRPRTTSEAVRLRTVSETVRLRTVSETVRTRTVSEIRIRAGLVQQGQIPEVTKPQRIQSSAIE